MHLALVENAANWTDDGGGAGAKHLQQPALGLGFQQLLVDVEEKHLVNVIGVRSSLVFSIYLWHGNLPLGDVELIPLLCHLDDASSRHSGKNDSGIQGRRDKFLSALARVQEDEEIHSADLGDLVITAVQPQNLLAIELLGLFLQSFQEKMSLLGLGDAILRLLTPTQRVGA